MARTKSKRSGLSRNEISVEALRDVSILFPDDVYLLARWIAMSDWAMATPTMKPGRTLHGLAQAYVSLTATSNRPLSAESVMERFREHGLEGNPVLRLPPEHAAAIAARIAGDETTRV